MLFSWTTLCKRHVLSSLLSGFGRSTINYGYFFFYHHLLIFYWCLYRHSIFGELWPTQYIWTGGFMSCTVCKPWLEFCKTGTQMYTCFVCLQYDNCWVAVIAKRICEPCVSGWVEVALSPKVNVWVTGRLELSYEVDVELKDKLTLGGHWSNGEDSTCTVCVCLVKLIDRDGRVFPETERTSCLNLKTDIVKMGWLWHTKTKRMQWLTTGEEDMEATSRRQREDIACWNCFPLRTESLCPTRVTSFFHSLFLLLLHHSFKADLLNFLGVLNALPPFLFLSFSLFFSLVLSLAGWKKAWNLSHIPNNYYHRKWS